MSLKFFKISARFSIVCLFLIVIAGLAGCEKLSQVMESLPFFKTKSQNAALEPAPAPSSETAVPENVLVRVGAWSLTLEEFKDRLEIIKEFDPEFNIEDIENRKLILEELVRQQLLVADAQESGLANRKDIVDAVEEFRRTLLVREIATDITEGVEATVAEAQDFYNQNKDAFAEPVEFHLREIMVPTQTEAQDILVGLLQGADFAETARSRSQGKTAPQGGDLGFIQAFPFEQMEAAIAALDVGAVSSVFKGPDGYYIVKLEEKKGGQPQDFTQLRDEIKTGLTIQKQQQAILDYLDRLKEKTQVTINEELLKQ